MCKWTILATTYPFVHLYLCFCLHNGEFIYYALGVYICVCVY